MYSQRLQICQDDRARGLTASWPQLWPSHAAVTLDWCFCLVGSFTPRISQTFLLKVYSSKEKNGSNADFCLIRRLLRCCEFTNINIFMHINCFLRPHTPSSIIHSSVLHSHRFPIMNVHHHHSETFSSKHLQMGRQSAGITDHCGRRTCWGRTQLDQNPSCQLWSLNTGYSRFQALVFPPVLAISDILQFIHFHTASPLLLHPLITMVKTQHTALSASVAMFFPSSPSHFPSVCLKSPCCWPVSAWLIALWLTFTNMTMKLRKAKISVLTCACCGIHGLSRLCSTVDGCFLPWVAPCGWAWPPAQTPP